MIIQFTQHYNNNETLTSTVVISTSGRLGLTGMHCRSASSTVVELSRSETTNEHNIESKIQNYPSPIKIISTKY